MKVLSIIGIGGFIGSILRYILSIFIQNKLTTSFPFGTLWVNIIGCFAIGILFGLIEKTTLSPEWRLFLVTGICGGFTTFSAFSIETFGMFREGQIFHAFAYISLSVIIGLIATYAGFILVKIG